MSHGQLKIYCKSALQAPLSYKWVLWLKKIFLPHNYVGNCKKMDFPLGGKTPNVIFFNCKSTGEGN